MDKRHTANIQVKNKITDALLALMKQQPFQAIRVSDIVKKADVARVSYYRNFESKEAILYAQGHRLHEEYMQNRPLAEPSLLSYDDILYHFEFYDKHRDFLLELSRHGLSYLLLDMFNAFIEDGLADPDGDIIEQSRIYCYAGAIFNLMLHWLKRGAKETPQVMAKAAADAFRDLK
ncbi:MAG: hypothetical protein CENE_01651 [Candidatus Celerinatantimonas neptuna]|nr:MAG: hypothetical protein CENE_01651 [Candidatus Celerinatantimonas neptuna]